MIDQTRYKAWRSGPEAELHVIVYEGAELPSRAVAGIKGGRGRQPQAPLQSNARGSGFVVWVFTVSLLSPELHRPSPQHRHRVRRSAGAGRTRFVEVEDEHRKSIKVGEWLQRPDGYWVLRLYSVEPEP